MAAEWRTELAANTLRLRSSIFGFVDFQSLIELRDDGRVAFSAGMISKEPGIWEVQPGDVNDGESDQDGYLQFTQPLTRRYADSFQVPGRECFWRGRLKIKESKNGTKEVQVEDGIVVSPREEGSRDLVREGSFTAVVVDAEGAEAVRTLAREAFKRALEAPRGDPTGFQTPARLAGIGIKPKQRMLEAERKKREQKKALKAAEDNAEIVDEKKS